MTGFTYDPVENRPESLPKPEPGEVMVRVGNWSLNGVVGSRLAKRLMCKEENNQHRWYDDYNFAKARLTAGVYRVRLPMPDSNLKSFPKQEGLLLSGEEVTRVAINTIIILMHLNETGNDLLKGNWCRCAEPLPGGLRVEVHVIKGRVRICGRGEDVCREDLWSSASRKVES